MTNSSNSNNNNNNNDNNELNNNNISKNKKKIFRKKIINKLVKIVLNNNNNNNIGKKNMKFNINKNTAKKNNKQTNNKQNELNNTNTINIKKIRKPNDIIPITKKNISWRLQLPVIKRQSILFDENDEVINPFFFEAYEQYLMYKWIKPDDVVLELGARYGIISCTINSMLKNKTNQVAVEPDKDVHKALEKNKKIFGAKFKICKYPISDTPLKIIPIGLGTYTINAKNNNNKKLKTNITFKEFMKKYKYKFTVLIADCEGCFCDFIKNCPDELFDNLKLIIFEKDGVQYCDYKTVINKFKLNGFKLVEKVLDNFQQVWIR